MNNPRRFKTFLSTKKRRIEIHLLTGGALQGSRLITSWCPTFSSTHIVDIQFNYKISGKKKTTSQNVFQSYRKTSHHLHQIMQNSKHRLKTNRFIYCESHFLISWLVKNPNKLKRLIDWFVILIRISYHCVSVFILIFL